MDRPSARGSSAYYCCRGRPDLARAQLASAAYVQGSTGLGITLPLLFSMIARMPMLVAVVLGVVATAVLRLWA